jgi:hypothetical protein
MSTFIFCFFPFLLVVNVSPMFTFSPFFPTRTIDTDMSRKWWWHGYLVSLCKVQLHLIFGRGYTIH